MPISQMPARMSRACLAISARRLAAQIGLHAAQPRLGLLGPVMADVGGDQRRVVGMLAGAGADLALELRVGEILVADRGHAQLLGRVDEARAHRQGEPIAVRVAHVGGDRLLQRFRADRLRHALVHEVEHRAHVHVHHHVGGRTGALGGDALGEAFLHEHRVDLDPGLRRERLDQRPHQPRFARRVEVDRLLGEGRRRAGGKARDGGCKAENGVTGLHLCRRSLNEHRFDAATISIGRRIASKISSL